MSNINCKIAELLFGFEIKDGCVFSMGEHSTVLDYTKFPDLVANAMRKAGYRIFASKTTPPAVMFKNDELGIVGESLAFDTGTAVCEAAIKALESEMAISAVQ